MIGLLMLAQAIVADPHKNQAMEQPPLLNGQPTARDLYVACYLQEHLRGDFPASALQKADGKAELFSFEYCDGMVLETVWDHEGKKAQEPRFCMPPEFDEDRLTPMTNAFIEFYEKTAFESADKPGFLVWWSAMKAKWPCR